MIETLEYQTVAGERADKGITVYALSTCGFCKRALAWLDANKFAYRYVHMDKLPVDQKNEAKRELKERYGQDVAFPYAVIDGEKALVGFVESDWKSEFGL